MRDRSSSYVSSDLVVQPWSRSKSFRELNPARHSHVVDEFPVFEEKLVATLGQSNRISDLSNDPCKCEDRGFDCRAPDSMKAGDDIVEGLSRDPAQKLFVFGGRSSAKVVERFTFDDFSSFKQPAVSP